MRRDSKLCPFETRSLSRCRSGYNRHRNLAVSGNRHWQEEAAERRVLLGEGAGVLDSRRGAMSGHGSQGRTIPGGAASESREGPRRRRIGLRWERSRRGPRPPLRPKRSPSGLAGLRSGRGPRRGKTKDKTKRENKKTKIKTKTRMRTKTKKGTLLIR